MNTLFPIFLNLEHKPCLVVGGGQVAFRKICGLLECQATIQVISPSSIPQILELQRDECVTLLERPYKSGDVEGSLLVVAATDDREVNRRVFQDCEARQILCNVVDTPESCSFYYGANYTCGELKMAISTNGVSPSLARKIKTELAEQYPQKLAPYFDYLGRMRKAVKEYISEESVRTHILQKIVADPRVQEQCLDEHFQSRMAHLDYEQEVERWR